MIPTLGRTVHYTVSKYDADAINKRRKDANDHMPAHREAANGTMVHVGNGVSAGDVYPLVITRVWGTTEQSAVNGQLLLDGNDVFWLTSVCQGDVEGTWREPVRV